MPPQVLTAEPRTIAAGTSVQWQRSYGDFSPADGWALKYYLNGPGGLTLAATDSAGAWLVSITPAQTANLKSGTYRWVAYAEKGADAALERYQVAAGTIVLTPNLPDAAPGALQTFAEKMLAAIEALMLGRATADQESMTIDGTAITRIPFEQLVRYRNQYAAEVQRQQNRGKLPPITVTFGRA